MSERTSRARAAMAAAAATAIVITLNLLAGVAARAEPVGVVERAGGEPLIYSESTERRIDAGTKVRQGDLLQTGSEGQLTVVFRDGSRLMIGADARVGVAGFVPEQGRRPGAIMLALEAGALRLQASRALRAPGKRLEIRSGKATISSEDGADLWCGLEDGKLAVLVLAGRVRVGNWSGSVMVERRRAGTFVANLLTPPEPVYGWERDKIKRLLTQVGSD